MRYFLHIGYDGSKYRGWQWQPNVPSVQQAIEKGLQQIFKSPITVYGCGRTDAGVHASQYILNINLDSKIDFDLVFRLNKNLPNDISVYDVWEMKEGQNARYDAISRTYDYFIHSYDDPILSKYSSNYELDKLDLQEMQKAASIFTKYEDFKAVCKQPHLYKHTLCTVTNCHLYVSEDKKRLRFTITANRFLRGMVRLSVSMLLKIGKGEISLEEFESVLINKIDFPEKEPALPNGLFLSKVEYPYLKVPSRTVFASFLKVGLED